MTAAADLTGRVFGNLKVLRREPSRRHNGNTVAYWRCGCKCGETVIVRAPNLASGNSTSCGCIRLGNRKGKGKLYDGKTAAQWVEEAGINIALAHYRLKTHGTVYRPGVKGEKELRVFEQDRDNRWRERGMRLGAAAPWHRAPSTKTAA
jgi:hypothetical protein